MSALPHRIFLAPCRPGVSWSEAQAHWRSHHEAVMLEMPDLVGYIQDRPCPEWWVHLPYLACSETWFAPKQWLFSTREHLLWFGQERERRPLRQPPARWPRRQTGSGILLEQAQPEVSV